MPPHTTHMQITINIQTHIQTFIQYAYSKTLVQSYVTAYLNTLSMGIHIANAHRETSLSHTGDYLHMDIH